MKMLNFDIHNHRPLREIVFEEIREMILKGEFEPGTRLMEIELAEELGVSRTPVREAIRKLEREGLVVIEARRGAYVSEISLKDTIDILELRSTLEGLAAELAAQRMTQQEKDRLYLIEKEFDDAVKEKDVKKMIECDTKFHHTIFEGSGNGRLIKMVESLQELVLRFRYIYYKDFKRAEEMPSEHMNIYNSIVSGDPERAREYAYNHIDVLRNMVINDGLIK